MSATLTFDYDSPLGTGGRSLALAPAGPKGDTGPAGPAPSGTGLVQVISGTASTLTHPDPSPAGSYTLASITVDAKGRVTAASSGSVTNITGNAATATALATPRAINGVSFDGTAAITVTAAAGTLTGTTLAATVVSSSLTSVGTLTGLTVGGTTALQGATTNLGAAAQAHTLQQVAPASGAGNSVTIASSAAVSGNTAGGSLILRPGAKSGSGTDGYVEVVQPGGTPGVNGVRISHDGINVTLLNPAGTLSTTSFNIGSGSSQAFLYVWGAIQSANYILAGTNFRTANFGGSIGAGGAHLTFNNGNTTAANLFILGTYTVATLPSASSNTGATARVSDSSVAASGNYGATVAGGGANVVKVFSNGSNWIIA